MSKKNKKTTENCIEFKVNGMHCVACELTIEKKLSKFEGVKKVDAVLIDNVVKIWGDFTEASPELADEMSKRIEADGYTLSLEYSKKNVAWHEFAIALPIALVIIVLFMGLQKLGIVSMFNPESINYTAIFLIGIIASLTTCMAVAGGLVLSISANYAKESTRNATGAMITFLLSRLISFFILGGLIGLLGAAFTLNRFSSFAMSFIVGFVMVILGLNLLDIFEFTKKLQLRMPKYISRSAVHTEKIQHRWTPALLGMVTFFLPCGFTQSMQIYSLSKGHFLEGALTMFVFALGTFPMLALISFASNKLASKKSASGTFLKIAGLIVLFFAVINLIGALVTLGVIDPIFNF